MPAKVSQVSVTELLCDDKKRSAYRDELRVALNRFVSLVKRIARDYDEVFGTTFCDAELKRFHALRIDVRVLDEMAADARRRLDALEQAFEDCRDLASSATAIYANAADPAREPLPKSIITEERALADRHGWPPLFTIFACVPIVAIVEQLAKRLKELAEYPSHDVRVGEWRCPDAQAVATMVAARDALLVPCREVTSVLAVQGQVIRYATLMVRSHRSSASPPPGTQARHLPSFAAHLFRCFSAVTPKM